MLFINISKPKDGVKHSISYRTTFSPNPHLVEEVNGFPFLHLDMFWTELNNHITLQQGPRSYIPLESICLCVAYCHEFHNRESFDGFFLPVERERYISPIWLNNHGKELWEFTLFSKLFSVTKIKIPKNTLKRITRHWIRPCLHKRIGEHLSIHFMGWKLVVPTEQ